MALVPYGIGPTVTPQRSTMPDAFLPKSASVSEILFSETSAMLLLTRVGDKESGKIWLLDLLDCILERSRHGDQMYDFHDFLIDYATKNGISLKSDPVMDEKIKAIFDRISERFFHRPLSDNAQQAASG